jgi:hypothetical protein
VTAPGAWMRSFVLVVAVSLAGDGRAAPRPQDFGPTAPDSARTVFVAVGLTADQTLTVATAFAASGHPGVLLFDGPFARAGNRRFLDAFNPARIAVVGSRVQELPGVSAESEHFACDGVQPTELWRLLFPTADRVVVCPLGPRRLLLHAAALAVAARAPLLVATESGLQTWLDPWQSAEVLAVGGAFPALQRRATEDGIRVRHLADDDAIAAATAEFASRRGEITALVLANPGDSAMAPLAPWIAGRRNAVLLLTNEAGTDGTPVVGKSLKQSALTSVSDLVVVGSPAAIPPERRPNPIVGKDEFIEMEPFTPAGREPFTLATGRLFHADPGVVALQLARARLLPSDGTPRKALVASNPGGSLPLLETCSRASAAELANRGYDVTPLFGRAVNATRLRDEFPRHDVVLWEGHHNTLVNDWKFPAWDEPLPPSFVFLQSCLALTEEKATPLLARGSVAVLGSSSRIYSATGGAFSGAYLDAMLYDRQSLGGALRQAKNFLAAYGQLKEKRLDNARLTGANLRSAWAFTLWGDPALRLPAPPVPTDAKPAVRYTFNGDTITVHVPEATSEFQSATSRYQVPFRPNARLAGLVRPRDEGKLLVPLVFAEVPLPHGTAGATPRLVTRLGETQWVFVWDARRRVGSLLAMPKATAAQVMTFRVEWEQIPSGGAAADSR